MFSRLYAHIPFCVQKCGYCSFYSVPADESKIADYCSLLVRELELASIKYSASSPLLSIYFGGGTPSLLSPQQIDTILNKANQLFGLSDDAEITVETNPGTISRDKLAGFRKAGVNRLSMGVQSFDDAMLASLGRIHTAQDAVDAISMARGAGFSNIGIDLIHSLPQQSDELWREDLNSAAALEPQHISLYGLSIEEGTLFWERYSADRSTLPDSDDAARHWEIALEYLTELGYSHYEISNFAKSGFEAQHNSGYWKRDGYLGIGAAAHSFLRGDGGNVRVSNFSDLDSYIDTVSSGLFCREEENLLTLAHNMEEFIFLGLRRSEGIKYRAFFDEFGLEMQAVFGDKIRKLTSMEFIFTNNAGIALTKSGMLLSNRVLAEFLF